MPPPHATARRPAALLATVLLALVALGGCGADGELTDRVAQLDRSQDELRARIAELELPDETDGQVAAEVEALAADVAEVRDVLDQLDARLETLGTEVETVRGDLAADADADAASFAELESRLGETASQLSSLRDDLTGLGDDLASVEVRFDSHRNDPDAHAGAPGGQ